MVPGTDPLYRTIVRKLKSMTKPMISWGELVRNRISEILERAGIKHQVRVLAEVK